MQSVPRRGRERVVIVVPALAEDEQRHEPVVPRLVAGAVVLAAEHVADRVHRERRVLVEEDPHEPAPDHGLDAALPRAADREAERERDPEGRHDPQQVQPVDRAHEPVLVEVAPVLAAALHALEREHPADVRVDEARDRAPDALRMPGVR